MIFSVCQIIWVLVILGPPYCGIGATIRIGREMLFSHMRDFFQILRQIGLIFRHIFTCAQRIPYASARSSAESNFLLSLFTLYLFTQEWSWSDI